MNKALIAVPRLIPRIPWRPNDAFPGRIAAGAGADIVRYFKCRAAGRWADQVRP
jgi:hypothetical protein